MKVVALFAVGVVLTLFMINWERKVVGRMQQRPGPNRVGPGGWLQSLADGLKLAFKEDIMPVMADKRVYFIAPIISCIPAFVAFSVIPFGGEVTIFGEQTVLQLVDLPVGVLVVLACSSVGVYGIVLAGWSSGSPYPLLAALRSAAQVISYEIALGLSVVGVVLYAGSLSTADIVASQQQSLWNVILLLPSFVVFVIAMTGETNRAPFDLPEAESELVGGFHTEYTSLKFALFFLAEYVNMVTVSAMATTLFLGGGTPPRSSNLNGWLEFVVFIVKTFIFLFVFIWLRGTLPRMRYDQFMRLGWKVLRPDQPAVDPADLRGAHLAAERRQHRCAAGRGRHRRRGRADHRVPGARPAAARRAGRRAGVGLPGAAARPGRAHEVVPSEGPEPPRAAHPGAVGEGERVAMFEFFKGFGVTFGTMFKKVVTEEYPENFPPAAPRYHGRHQLNRHPDGLEKCVGCELCAWACPADAIYVEGGDNTEEERYSPGERYGADLPDQLPALHRLRAVRRGVPHPLAHDDQLLRDGRRQPPGPDLHQGATARSAAAGHGAAAAPDAPRRQRAGLLRPRPDAGQEEPGQRAGGGAGEVRDARRRTSSRGGGVMQM